MQDATGSKRLVGYVTPGSASAKAVTAHCRSLLIPAMVPSVVVVLETFPMLPGGKVDIKALPAPDWSAAGADEFVAPSTDLEATLARVWQQVLGRPDDQPLSMTADFFAAGGTSLQVFRLNAVMQKELGLASLPATLVHTARTVQATATALSELLSSGVLAEQQRPITAHAWDGAERPLSANQEQMWLLR
jgi:hypothetical protein